MRIRSIKPEFWRSPDISCLSIEDRLLFIGLWSYVDDNGVGEDRESMVAADLFADDLSRDPRETFARVSRGLANLSEAGRIVRYTVAGRDFLEITNWTKHQRIDKPARARHPHVSADGAVIRDTLARAPEVLAPGTGEQGNRGTEDQGTGEQGSGTSAPTALAIESAFSDAYDHWPKKVERKQAFERFKIAARKRELDELTADVIRFGDAYAATTERQFVPALGVWLNGERWTDELPRARANRYTERTAGNLAVVQRMAALDAPERLEIGQ